MSISADQTGIWASSQIHGRHVDNQRWDAWSPGAWAVAQHPPRACNPYRYVSDVKHNTAVWVLVWLFVAALVLALINAAVLTKLN